MTHHELEVHVDGVTRLLNERRFVDMAGRFAALTDTTKFKLPDGKMLYVVGVLPRISVWSKNGDRRIIKVMVLSDERPVGSNAGWSALLSECVTVVSMRRHGIEKELELLDVTIRDNVATCQPTGVTKVVRWSRWWP